MRNEKGQYIKGHLSSKPKNGSYTPCINCGKLIYVFPGRETKFCSTKCSAIVNAKPNSGRFQKGMTFPERRNTITKNCIVCHIEFEIRKSHADKRTTCSKKCSASLLKGRKPWNYIEDRSKVQPRRRHKQVEHIEWAKAVKSRDNWECQLADSSCSGPLESHHILNWSDNPELRHDVNNGITLCKKHHPRGRKAEGENVELFQSIVNSKMKKIA